MNFQKKNAHKLFCFVKWIASASSGIYDSAPHPKLMTAKLRSRITWRQKLERQQEPKIVDIPARMQPRFGKGRMLIPRPLDVDALIRRVGKGKLVTVQQLRQELARRGNVELACPLCTGIFIRIVAEA